MSATAVRAQDGLAVMVSWLTLATNIGIIILILKESCIVRIAARECEDSCGFDGDFVSTSSGYKDSSKPQIPILLYVTNTA
jgi:hypothetical protein